MTLEIKERQNKIFWRRKKLLLVKNELKVLILIVVSCGCSLVFLSVFWLVFVSSQNPNLNDNGHEDVREGGKDSRGVEVVLQHVAHEHRQAGEDVCWWSSMLLLYHNFYNPLKEPTYSTVLPPGKESVETPVLSKMSRNDRPDLSLIDYHIGN